MSIAECGTKLALPKILLVTITNLMILILPHSNASAEWIFSFVTSVKTKKINRVGDNTVVTIIRSSFQDKNLTAI